MSHPEYLPAPLDPVPLPASLEATAAQARAYMEAAKAVNTLRAYRSDWTAFGAWCETHTRQALPASPETVALYLAAAAESLKPATLQRRLASISQAHQVAGYETPTRSAPVRTVWQGLVNTHGVAPAQKAPLLVPELLALVGTCARDAQGMRDRALLLLGFAGAFRRSELVGLDVSDISFGADGVTATVRRSKTDQQGAGRLVGIPRGAAPESCPVRALRAWVQCAGLKEGPLFRGVNRHGTVQTCRLTAQAVALVVKRRAAAAGLEPAQFAGHSLRAGLATSAAAAGASERSIMAQTGHRSERVARRYIRAGSLFRENAAAGLL